jgi:hypothetical protein
MLSSFTDSLRHSAQDYASQGHPGEVSVASDVLLIRPMTNNIIVMPGQVSFDLGAVHSVAGEFGWTVGIADDLRDAAAGHAYRRTSTVLFHRDAFRSDSWVDAVRLLKSALPGVRPVACHGFSELIDWPELCDAGAFHSLWLPLKENELRRTFGFVWEAEKRLSEAADRVPIILRARKRSTPQRIQPALAHGIRTRVMASAAG